jgi:PAS domain S-box-containing protein
VEQSEQGTDRPVSVLVVGDDGQHRDLVRMLARQPSPMTVREVSGAGEFAAALDAGGIDVVVTESKLSWSTGRAILLAVKARLHDVPVIMLTEPGDEETTIEAFRAGLDDCVSNDPGEVVRLPQIVSAVLERSRPSRILPDESLAVAESIVDAAGRRRAEQALLATELRYRALVEQMPAVTHISALDERSSTIYISPQIEKMLGYGPAEWTADPDLWPKVLHPADREEQLDLARRHVAGEPMRTEYRMISREGRTVWVHSEATIILGDDGNPAFSQGVWLDITDRKHVEEEVRGLNLALEARVAERTGQLESANQNLMNAKEEADRANKEKSEFLSRMSHELRTPLNAVLGFAQLLEMDELSDSQMESVDQIRRGGRHLLGLINELLDIGRIEAGRLALTIESVALTTAVREAAELIGPIAAARDITVHVDRETMQDRHILADRERLHQVLLNLLSNAVKYNGDRGSVTVSCSELPNGRLVVTVADTGPGIPAEKMDRLFTPFERLGAESTGVEGTGLGLVFVKRLVEAMGGQVSAESQIGEGSTFHIELARADQRRTLAFPSDRPGADAVDAPAMQTVLYIEDEFSNLALVLRIMAGRPHLRLLVAMQGGIGLDLARDQHPDLILLDLNLPDVLGNEVLARLQEDTRTCEIPVLVISADATSVQMERMLAAGAREYLTKPFDVNRFLSVLDEYLGGNVLPENPAMPARRIV